MVKKLVFDKQAITSNSSLADCRAEIYLALAEALAEPPEWLALPGREWPLTLAVSQLAQELAGGAAVIKSLMDIPAEPLEARRARFDAIFAGPGRPNFWLYESMMVYGRLLHPSTARIERLYQACGLQTVGAELPDHASMELAFLAYLTMQQVAEPDKKDEWRKVETSFIEQHAGRWLPALGRSLAATNDEVYAPIGNLLFQWLVKANHPVQGRLADYQPLPHMRRPSDCTLCGFCLQICPTKSLKIRETDTETTLHLNIFACTGCQKCSRICPSKALEMDISQTPLMVTDEWQLLFCSPRTRCPGCGLATISQAELNYVAAQLGNPVWLPYCLPCRAEMKEYA